MCINGVVMNRLPLMVRITKAAFPTAPLVARLTKVPVLGRTLDHMLFQGDKIIYLPKDEVVPVMKSAERHGEMVVPSQVVEQLVREANYHVIMNFCICRSSMGCKDYPIELGCLFLGEAAVGINPKLARRVGKEEALEHLRRCRKAGLVHLAGRNKLDTIWLQIGPGSRLLTICNCCPCCCLWRSLPHISSKISSKITGMPGVIVEVTDRCVGCGTCTKGVCFVNAIKIIDKKAVISEQCRGCGRCVLVCPNNAIELRVEDTSFLERSLEEIRELVDIT
jgi:ferredoxin